MHHPKDRIAHTTAFVTPVIQHWLERDYFLEDCILTASLIIRATTAFGKLRSSGLSAIVSTLDYWGTPLESETKQN